MMNYNMQGMTKMISKLFAMLKSVKVEIKKEHQVLMVNKTTSFKKKGDFVNHQHLRLFLDFYLRQFRHPLQIIVHHKVLVAW